MMGIMAAERGGSVFATDERFVFPPLLPTLRNLGLIFNEHRFCIDNGIMIAHAGLLSYRMGYTTPLEETECTQR